MVKRLLDFLNASPVNFLAAKNIAFQSAKVRKILHFIAIRRNNLGIIMIPIY